jgi:hypothetical protein
LIFACPGEEKLDVLNTVLFIALHLVECLIRTFCILYVVYAPSTGLSGTQYLTFKVLESVISKENLNKNINMKN